MRAFRFRAAGALDLRKKQEDDARVVLTRAQNVAAAADARLAGAEHASAEARARFAALQQQGATGWLIQWHRSWILRQARQVDACRQQSATAHAMVRQAAVIVQQAHRQRRVLERLRDRLAARHARAMEREELAQMNELATMRFLIARAAERKESP